MIKVASYENCFIFNDIGYWRSIMPIELNLYKIKVCKARLQTLLSEEKFYSSRLFDLEVFRQLISLSNDKM